LYGAALAYDKALRLNPRQKGVEKKKEVLIKRMTEKEIRR